MAELKRWQIIIDGLVVLVGLALGGAAMALTDSEIASALNELGIDEAALLAGVLVAQQAFNRAVSVWRALRGLIR